MPDPISLKLREGAVAWQEVEGETILLDLAASEYLGVNRSGSVLWSALIEGATEEQLIDQLCAAYDIPRQRATADVTAFLDDCRNRDFLEG